MIIAIENIGLNAKLSLIYINSIVLKLFEIKNSLT
tara:strand:- start:5396 stop:5500 length:105 start_codon:yes stop_codon:yes gene_type:complete